MPCAADVDYTNVEEICDYQILLSKIFEESGGLVWPQVVNPIIIEVQRQGAYWLKEVRQIISQVLIRPITADMPSHSTLRLRDIPGILDSYDICHRICKGVPELDYIRDVRLKIVDRWLNGDKDISQTDIVLCILKEADCGGRYLDNRYLTYAYSILGTWVDELIQGGRFPGIPLDEAYARLIYMIKEDLSAYIGKAQSKVKKIWVKEYSIPCGLVKTIDSLDTKTLQNYIIFVRYASALGYLADEYLGKNTDHLCSQLESRPDVHPFLREAIRIDLRDRGRYSA